MRINGLKKKRRVLNMTEIFNKKAFLLVNSILRMVIIMFLVSGSIFMPLVMAQSPPGRDLRVLRSDGQAIVLELKVDDFRTETKEYEGQTYQRLIIPPMVQSARPGEPQVPVQGAMVGIPSTNGVSVKVIGASYETLTGYRLYPAPELQATGDTFDSILTGGIRQTVVFDQDIYATDAFYPGKTVEIGYTGYMRDQPVAQVQFYPVQYNPVTGELRLYRRILAMVTWNPPLPEATVRKQGAIPAYENLLKKSILNYGALKRPPVTGETPHGNNGIRDIDAGSVPTTLKIGVTEDGMYKLTYHDIVNAGLDLNTIDPRTIRIRNQGAEIPIYVQGEGDGVFDTTDYILFYGIAIKDSYTSRNVYWLTADGGAGQRMKTLDGAISGKNPVPTHFPSTLHAEEDSYYWQTIPNGAGEDHWFWDDKLTAPESKDYSLTLNNISATAGTATVRVRLKGRTDIQTNPDHHTKIYLNNFEVDDQSWDGMTVFDHEVTVPHSYLNEGANTIRVEAVGDTGAAVDQVFVNWLEIDCFDTYVAEKDNLLFGAPANGTFQFEVSGFIKNDVDVFDITDAANVMRIVNTTIEPNTGTYTLKFRNTAQTGTRYLAQTLAQSKSPADIGTDQPSSWKSVSNGADYIIITHEDFSANAQAIAAHRSDSGLRVATVKVEDIYDEFNYGVFHPQAIRDFLIYAYNNWVAPAPVYVLLLGDACQDYKDNLDTGTVNYVPSQLIETDILGETPSDNWFVLTNGDDILPDMFIGRLSAETKQQMDDIVSKIIHYGQNPPDKSWNTDVLFVADDDDSAFEEMSEDLADLLPDNYTANKVYAGDYTSGNPTTDITKYINKGNLLVNYTGHGAVDRWGLWDDNTKTIFDNADIQSLNNTHKLTVVTVGDCLNGFFTGTNPQVSVAEEFQRLQDKGAAAVWAPTALSYTSGHQLLISEFYKAIFQDGQYSLGAATTAAKIATYTQNSFWGELVETFVLFGDPAMQLGLSTEFPLSVITPNGGEVISAGSAFTIQWKAPESMMKFKLKYSLDNGRSWKKIAKDVEGTSYDWDVPGTKNTKKKCLIEVIGYDESGKKSGKDRSDSTFTIEKNNS